MSDPATFLRDEKCKEGKKTNVGFVNLNSALSPSCSACRKPGQHLALSAASEKRSAVDSGGVEWARCRRMYENPRPCNYETLRRFTGIPSLAERNIGPENMSAYMWFRYSCIMMTCLPGRRGSSQARPSAAMRAPETMQPPETQTACGILAVHNLLVAFNNTLWIGFPLLCSSHSLSIMCTTKHEICFRVWISLSACICARVKIKPLSIVFMRNGFAFVWLLHIHAERTQIYCFNRVCLVDFFVTDINMCNLMQKTSTFPLDIGQWVNWE